MDLLSFILKVIQLCYQWQGSVSSWGRTKTHNKDVGGLADSWHRLWLGIDVILDTPRKNQAFESDAKRVGLEAIWEKDHYHLEPL